MGPRWTWSALDQYSASRERQASRQLAKDSVGGMGTDSGADSGSLVLLT